MLSVLYEDNHLLVVNKPAGLTTQGADEGEDSLVMRAKEYVKQKYNKPGNVFIGVVSRLDSLVTGVVVLARTSKAAARLSEVFRERTSKKLYWAVVGGRVSSSAELVDWVVKDDRAHRMVITSKTSPGAQEARMNYRLLERLPEGRSLLEIELVTGRKHQIRLQLSHHGLPILGDYKYGSDERFAAGIALHSRFLQIPHPTQSQELKFLAPLPNSWKPFGISENRVQTPKASDS